MKGRIVGFLGLLLAAGANGGASAEGLTQRAAAPLDSFAERLLIVHNQERNRVGVPPLVWSSGLAHEARNWAQKLAREGWLRHASLAENGGTGENLWMGTAGHFPLESMIHSFIKERRHYRHGRFPNVSHTGDWQDVGHYTQIVWRETREVGCAVARGSGSDVLVCRYWPAGNWAGQPVY